MNEKKELLKWETLPEPLQKFVAESCTKTVSDYFKNSTIDTILIDEYDYIVVEKMLWENCHYVNIEAVMGMYTSLLIQTVIDEQYLMAVDGREERLL